MINSGIVRRVDDLGRIVIPKELRRALFLEENTPMEISVDGDTVTLKRYSTLENQVKLTGALVRGIAGHFGLKAAISDDIRIVAAQGLPAWVGGRSISQSMRDALKSGTVYRHDTEDVKLVAEGDLVPSVMTPIIVDGQPIGGVFILDEAHDERERVLYEQCSSLAASLLSDYFKL